MNCDQSTILEAHAIRLACMFLRALGLSNLQVESDNQEVIALCVSELVPPCPGTFLHSCMIFRLCLLLPMFPLLGYLGRQME
ncbi:hypothetical protein ACSBR2_006633 [Camellia fascicularis]